VGLEMVDLEFLNVYPNPVEDILHIETDEDLKKISVVDLSGKTCLQFDLIRNLENSYSIDLSQLEKGVYFLYVQKNRFSNPFKFLKN
jgi:hypothetical protein